MKRVIYMCFIVRTWQVDFKICMEINGIRIAKIFLNNNDGGGLSQSDIKCDFETTLIKTNTVYGWKNWPMKQSEAC